MRKVTTWKILFIGLSLLFTYHLIGNSYEESSLLERLFNTENATFNKVDSRPKKSLEAHLNSQLIALQSLQQSFSIANCEEEKELQQSHLCL